jgi:Zn-dependent protease with chaperone function
MADTVELYPPSPAHVPPGLTAPSGSYKTRVVIVLGSLILFVALYIGLVVGSAYFSYWSFSQLGAEDRPVRTSRGTYYREKDNRGWWLIPGICSGLLCLFLVKGFFKRQRVDPSMRVEITEKDEPELFAFIRRLCQETKAPFPHRIYLVPEVNAAVFYHSSFLRLFLPAPKNLLIGLGLVNRLNLSEFKAVLAHEFGHFSQSSMKLGTYVYTSNRIVCDLVYGRDWLDDMVAALGRIDIRIAIFAWGFMGVLWGLRKGLEGLFKAINFANSALSRQMEFNADLVAVSVTGSDALVHGLARLDFANDALMQAWHDLSAAADHRLYTRDFFYHQTRAAYYLRQQRKDPKLGEPPLLPEDPTQKSQIFEPGDSGVPLMWATHPSNHDREQNAKRQYIRVSLDERPAWALFHDAAAVREKVTHRFYEVVKQIKDPPLTDAEAVQAFIDDEHAETTYQERYHGMYDDRYVLPGDLDALMTAATAEFADPSRLSEACAALYSDELKKRMETCQEHRKEQYILSGLVSGSLSLKGKDFPFRDGRYRAVDAPRLLSKVEKELKADHEWLNTVDRQVFIVHYALARHLGGETSKELDARYRFHLAVQEILNELTAYQSHVQQTLGRIAGQRQIAQEVFQATLGALRQARDAFEQKLQNADKLLLPPLKHMTAGAPLGKFLLERPLVRALSASTSTLDGKWITQFMEQLNEVITKTRRIHFKSLGGILALQEKVAETWKDTQMPCAAPAPQLPTVAVEQTAC